MTILQKIRSLLASSTIEFREIHHPPTLTSEDSARERGEDISVGGKAIVMKVGDRFVLLVISAAKQLDSLKIKQYFQEKKARFASKEELLELTGLVPGSVPPFGQPILSLPLYADTSITQNKIIAFNAGSLTDSIIMKVTDYLKIAQPNVFEFGKA